MSRLHWTTYDTRGLAWRRARTRFIAAVVVVGVASVSGLTGVADRGRANTGLTATADLALLAQRVKAEEAALSAAHQARVLRIEADGAKEQAAVTERVRGGVEQLHASARAAATARAEREVASLQQVDADLRVAQAALRARLAQERVAIEAFFDGLVTGLGQGTPTRSALDAAKKQLESRRSGELNALSTVHTAEYAELKRRTEAATAAISGQLATLDADTKTQEDALAAELTIVKRGLAEDLAGTVQAIDAEVRTVKVRHAQELLDLEDLHAAQLRVVPSASRRALETKQSFEEDELKAMQAAELAAQAAAKRAAGSAESAARHAAEAAHDLDRAALSTASSAAKAALSANRSATAASGSAQLSALDGDHDRRYAAVKATYDSAVAGIGKGVPGLVAARTDRLTKDGQEQLEAIAALGATGDARRRTVVGEYDEKDSAAHRRLKHDIAATERSGRHDHNRAEWQTKQALGRAARDYDRQQRLLKSDYFTLRIRALAFLERPDSYASVTAAFDPATDPGSLYNVARRIGATAVPADVTGRSVGVALIDTGVVDAPALENADVEIGPDFSFEDVVSELRGRDTMGHGTHLAGIIAARDAAWVGGDRQRRPERVLGIAPDARLVSVKAGAADGAADVTQIIAAINWVVANKDKDGRNIRVLNLSFGTDGVQDHQLDPLSYAVERVWRAGIVVVVAAGNDGWAAPGLTNPARNPFVIAVGSSQAVNGKDDVPSDYSNGAVAGRGVDLAAPGRSIVSVRNEGSRSDERNQVGRVGDTMVRASGTSQAAAVVSGAAALLLSARPGLNPDQVKHVLMASAVSPDGDDVELVGAGYLRVHAALGWMDLGLPQTWQPATGLGTLDGARGSVRVLRDGIVLEGEFDIFGSSWSGSRWTQDAWSGSRWTGSRWTEAAWTGSRWTGSGWSADVWTGPSWSGSRWTADIWSGSRWTGSRWTSDGFTGSRWTGSRWTAGGWFGVGWDDGPATETTAGAEPVTAEAVSAAAAS